MLRRISGSLLLGEAGRRSPARVLASWQSGATLAALHSVCASHGVLEMLEKTLMCKCRQHSVAGLCSSSSRGSRCGVLVREGSFEGGGEATSAVCQRVGPPAECGAARRRLRRPAGGSWRGLLAAAGAACWARLTCGGVPGALASRRALGALGTPSSTSCGLDLPGHSDPHTFSLPRRCTRSLRITFAAAALLCCC